MDETRNKPDNLGKKRVKQDEALKNCETQLASNQEAYARLLHKISQDLLLPMNGVIGAFKDSTTPTLVDKKQKNEGVINSINGLMTVVQSMSALAALMQDELNSDVKEFSIKKLFEELVSTYQFLTASKRIELKYKFYSDMPEKVEGDFAHLKLILSGLLSNAIKNTKDGWISLSAEHLSKSDDKMVIRLKIADSGKGIGTEKQNQIRETLEEESILEMLSSKKVGMGLILASMLGTKLQGQFDFESEKSVGSSFWVDVPLHPVKSSEKLLKSDNHPYKAVNQRNILLVEDNYLNQKFVTAALLKAGHSIEIAENGKVALDKYRSKTYDLILMDIQMPLVDGLETTQIIRKEEKKYKKTRTPIIAVTAYAIEHDKQKCLAAGMDEYLTKPFKPLELLQIIDNL